MSDFTRLDDNHVVIPVQMFDRMASVYYKFMDGRLVEPDQDLDDDLDQDDEYEVGDDFRLMTPEED